MKPVSVNQLLFHPRSDCLSFYQSPEIEDFESFLDDINQQLVLQEKFPLAKLLAKNRPSLLKIIKAQSDKSHGFFIASDLQGYLTLEQKSESFCIIGQTFHIRPVLEELLVNPEYIIVNVSLYDIKVFRGDYYHVEMIQQYEFDQLPKVYSETRFFTPKMAGLIPYKSILAMKTIAQKVRDLTIYQNIPVIVTGLEEMKQIFLGYFGESFGIITHFHDDFYEKTCVEIFEKSKVFRHAVTDYYSVLLKDRLKRILKSKHLITNLPDVINAISLGRVIHLVLPTKQKIWGRVDLVTGEFVLHKKLSKSSVDILNELAEEVIRQGGKIQFLGPHFFPANTSLLAILKG